MLSPYTDAGRSALRGPPMYRSLFSLLTFSSLLVLSGCPDDTDSGSVSTTANATTGSVTTGGPATSTTGSELATSSSSGLATGSTSTGDAATDTDTDTDTDGAALPDIDMSVVLDDTIASLSIDTQFFAKDACEVIEGCVGGPGMRRLLRFDTITPNLGEGHFLINDDKLGTSACTGAVFEEYADYRLFDAKNNEVGVGFKAAFLLIDILMWVPNSPPAMFGFDEMGISAGWADIYSAGLQCQWVDITDVPPGDYTLQISVNEDEVIEESTYDNNIVLVPVTIPPGPG